MNRHYIVTTAIVLAVVAAVGAMFAIVYEGEAPAVSVRAADRSDQSSGQNQQNASAAGGAQQTAPAVQPAIVPGEVVFDPPAPEEAPPDIRDAVMYGYNILMETKKYVPQYVGNDLNCRNCHFQAGRIKETLSLVGVAAKYPKYRSRHDYSSDLVTRTSGCFERSENGTAPPPESKEMEAIMAYYHWISKGIPIYADIPWLGLKHLDSQHTPDKGQGMEVFSTVCSVCHGPEGQGTGIAPPLWGPGSFNDGAGMSDLPNFAAFAYKYMPRGNPTLTEEQALDVAAFATTQPRPHYTSSSGGSSSSGQSSSSGSGS